MRIYLYLYLIYRHQGVSAIANLMATQTLPTPLHQKWKLIICWGSYEMGRDCLWTSLLLLYLPVVYAFLVNPYNMATLLYFWRLHI